MVGVLFSLQPKAITAHFTAQLKPGHLLGSVKNCLQATTGHALSVRSFLMNL